MNIPEITSLHLSIELVDSGALGAAGPGEGSFVRAIQCKNAHDYDESARLFNAALDEGLDVLRQGYAHAALGEMAVQNGDLATAVEHFFRVLTFGQSLYESVNDAAQYLEIVLSEIRRTTEAGALRQLAATTTARLGFSLSESTRTTVRELVKESVL